MNVRFCPSCRSLILSEFRFCPYCGAAVESGPGLCEALEAPFARIARMEESAVPRSGAEGRFAELEERLDRLEIEMDLLVGELERSGRKQG